MPTAGLRHLVLIDGGLLRGPKGRVALLGDATALMLAALQERPFLLAFLVIVLEVPRYTGAIVVMLLAGLRRTPDLATGTRSISAIIPAHNEAATIAQTVTALLAQPGDVSEVFLVDDGSTDDTRARMQALAATDARITVLHHDRRAGKSAAINHAARFARGALLLVIDADTRLRPGAVARLAAAFDDPKVAGASGNLLVANVGANPLTGLQSLEYMLSISLGRRFLDHLDALACLSGAFSMFRRSAFRAVGGLNVGPGEDLEITLRLRRAGFRVRFVGAAVAETGVPAGPRALLRQRLRWDRDALAIRVFMYRQLGPARRGEPLAETLQRLDFILLELLPTLVFPLYLAGLALQFGADFTLLLSGVYVALLWLYGAHFVLGSLALRRIPRLADLVLFPVLPLYQGVILKLVRFHAFTDEILFAGSRHDPYVPARVRRALYGSGGRLS